MGPASASGCPDLDGDGVRDSQDACPDEPAPGAGDGCPTVNDPSPAADAPEPEAEQSSGDGDEWNGDPNETHDATEQAGGGAAAYPGSTSGDVYCDSDDTVYGEAIFDYAGSLPGLASTRAATSAEDSLVALLSLPQMPAISVMELRETTRSEGFRRYALFINNLRQVVIELAETPSAGGWVPYRFAACSKITNKGVPAR